MEGEEHGKVERDLKSKKNFDFSCSETQMPGLEGVLDSCLEDAQKTRERFLFHPHSCTTLIKSDTPFYIYL